MNLNQINRLNFEEVLLQKLNIEPLRKSGNSLFYISPFRPEENTASFHVTLSNPYDLFYDHGNGLGGKIADFFILYLDTNPKGVCKYFNQNFSSFHQQKNIAIEKKKENKDYEIIDVKPIETIPLIDYLNSRKIPIDLAKKYCKEIHYSLGIRTYYAVGFPTENGFEIRNKYVKMCLDGKGLSWFKNGKNAVKIFECWSDFLSYLVLFPEDELGYDFLVLNSTSLLRKRLNEIKNYERIHCYFDHDNAGKNAYQLLKNELKNSVKDFSYRYAEYNDLNEMLVNEKRAIKNRYSPK